MGTKMVMELSAIWSEKYNYVELHSQLNHYDCCTHIISETCLDEKTENAGKIQQVRQCLWKEIQLMFLIKNP